MTEVIKKVNLCSIKRAPRTVHFYKRYFRVYKEGLGNPVASYLCKSENGETIHTLTSTNVLLIMNVRTHAIITVMVPTKNQLKRYSI